MFKKIFWFSVCIVAILLIHPLWYLVTLPDTSKLVKTNPSTSAIREFREEQTVEKGREPRSQMIWRDLDQLSLHLQHAVVLAEDDTFFQHDGFDREALKTAVRTNWERRKFAFGASTITQQLARTLYLSSNKNLLRKAKEALITRRLEKTVEKKRILEIYLNVVEWGPQIYGAEAASQHYFGKAAIDLSSDEAIALAAILPSPRRWSPIKETKFMTRRKATLTDRMIRAHYLVPVESSETVAVPLSTDTELGPPTPDEEVELGPEPTIEEGTPQ